MGNPQEFKPRSLEKRMQHCCEPVYTLLHSMAVTGPIFIRLVVTGKNFAKFHENSTTARVDGEDTSQMVMGIDGRTAERCFHIGRPNSHQRSRTNIIHAQSSLVRTIRTCVYYVCTFCYILQFKYPIHISDSQRVQNVNHRP